MLAAAEVRMEKERGALHLPSNYNRAEALVEYTGTTRPLNTIKKLRSSQEYKAMIDEINSRSEASNTEAPAAQDTVIEETTVNPTKEIWAEQILQKITSVSQGLIDKERLTDIVPGSFQQSNLELVNTLFAEFCERNPARPFTPKQQTKLKLPQSRRRRRKALFKILQRLWFRNRARCAKMVASGEFKTMDVVTRVTLEQLETFWRPLMETPSKEDSRNPEAIHPVAWTAMQPISIDDIKWALESCNRKTSPGPDGRTVPDVVKIPKQEIMVLFNTWLLSACLPTELCKGRTTLIPKETGTDDPAKFRPITVTSILCRLYNKIVARRLEEQCPVGIRQKAFQSGDGMAENVHLLQSAIRYATQQKTPKPLYICFLDVKKAFDSVSHESLLKACQRMGLPEPLVEYVRGLYQQGSTCLAFNGKMSRPIKCGGGVKQGDPLSCYLFNSVIDWILTSVDPNIGFQYVDCLLSFLAFADDLVLFATTKKGLQTQVNKVVEAMGLCGLSVNPVKCATLGLRPDTKIKKSLTETKTIVKIDGVAVPTIIPGESYKYLGTHVTSAGTFARVDDKLKTQLTNTREAPLKPQQRLFILRSNIIPATYHQLVLARTNKGALNELDRIIRVELKRWLKLPHTIPDSFVYSHYMDGGLGIKSLRWTVPRLKVDRMLGMAQSQDPLTVSLATRPEIQDQIRSWSKPVELDGHPMDTAEQQQFAWRDIMVKTADCYGLRNASCVPYANRWVTDGSLLMSGHRFCAAVALRCGALYSKQRRARGTNLDPSCDHCGPGTIEYLGHIIQSCPRTHGPRIHRHNLLVHKLVKMLTKKKWRTIVEPTVKTRGTWVKPDIVAWNDDRALVIDAIVHSDDPRLSPNHHHFAKVSKYEAIPELKTFVTTLTGHEPEFSALAINWRGAISPQTELDMRSYGIRKKDLSFLSAVTIEQSTWIHQQFMKSTTRSMNWRR